MILFVGSDVNRQDVDGRTPLMLACAHDDGGKCVEYLLQEYCRCVANVLHICRINVAYLLQMCCISVT